MCSVGKGAVHDPQPIWSTDGTVNKVYALLQAQQQQMSALAAKLEVLHDKHEALCACLSASGMFSSESLLAWMHRCRFATTLRRHPFLSHESLETVAQTKELTLMVATRAGVAALVALGMACRTLRSRASFSTLELVSLFPATIFAVGGEARGAALDSVECFDSLSNSWRPGVPLRTARSGCATVAMGGFIYVVGGCNADGEDLCSVERLNRERCVWEPLPAMSAGRDELAAAATGGLLYAAGGSHLVWPERHVIDTAEYYDLVVEAWVMLPSMCRERCAAGSVSFNDSVFVLGGCDEDGTSLDSAERFDTTTGGWRELPRMRSPRCNFAAASIRGLIFVAGGYDDRMRDLDQMESFNPMTSTWDTVASLSVPRWGVRAAACGGAMFIVGGHACDVEISTLDRYDPASGMWANMDSLRIGRRSFGLAACWGQWWPKGPTEI